MDRRLVSRSKFLSLVLRHQPERIGITLDAAGWVAIELLLAACAAHGQPMTRGELEQTVRDNDKQRFAVSPDGQRIRASQGHSVAVALDYSPCPPPAVLYHGTVERFVASIRRQGLLKRDRHHVHLSASFAVAKGVGARRDEALVLTVRAEAMAAAGFTFFQSANGVWLTDHVPPDYSVFP